MRFAVIDTANLFHRCQHVTQGDAFTKAGMALHIVFRALRKLHRDFKVEHMVFCTEGRSWRHDVFPQYKAKRKLEGLQKSQREKDEEEVFFHVLNSFIEFIAEKTRCTLLHSPGVEGDDFIARWVQLHPNDEHFILTGDSDFVQLLAPNVTIIDGVEERILKPSGITDYKGNNLVFSVDPSKGKIKVDKKAKPDPKFVPEPEWWRMALFIKCIRGDISDNIFSAAPGASSKGTSKRTGIMEAWADRNGGGYHWNNFFLQKWQKLKGTDDEGNPIMEDVRVLDEYRFNETLIDLTKQPDEIKELMDTCIVQAVQKEPVGNIGIHFMRFCAQHELTALTKEAKDHADYLAAPYSKG